MAQVAACCAKIGLCAAAVCFAFAAAAPASQAAPQLNVSPSGHYICYGDEVLLLAGDSGTQCVLQNLNLDYRQWLDDCASRRIRAVHVWSFLAPRQKQDGSVVEPRYGYVYPGVTPWARRRGGPPAADGLPQWDLTRFDEGREPKKHYWPRLRDLCAFAQARGIIVGITVFFGWPKHNTPARPDWTFHPFNELNGGFLHEDKPIVTACQTIAEPGREVLAEEWSESWPAAKKTQWVWERFADKLIRETQRFGNVFFVFMDEHSYPEGNCGEHFLRFFKRRGALWVDWERRRREVDFVMTETFSAEDKNARAVSAFYKRPPRPVLHLEGGPYLGDGARKAMWTFLIGGGHYFYHDDAGQETMRTGIQGYDPHVPGGDKGMQRRDWLGYASRFFNEGLARLDAMVPHNELVLGGKGYCLAAPGAQYAVYSPEGETIALDLSAARGARAEVQFYDPRTGRWRAPLRITVPREGRVELAKPDGRDWALRITVAAGSAAHAPAMEERV